jgi:GAF domain-containing protein
MKNSEASDHQEALQQQTVLARFGEFALRCDDLDEILTEACRLIGDALGSDLAKVMQLQDNGKTLLVRAGVGWNPGIVGRVTIQLREDTSEGHALKTGHPVTSDIETEKRFQYPSFLTDHGVKAVANVVHRRQG